MDTEINWIENYIDGLHREQGYEPEKSPLKEELPTKVNSNNTKISLDVSILQQRIDSVGVIKYYKDLKNDRLKLNENITVVDDEQLFKNMTAHDDSKPWNKQDRYTKIKRINNFIEKLIQKDPGLDKKIIITELMGMLETKKINKKNTEFDTDNNIIKMGNYSL